MENNENRKNNLQRRENRRYGFFDPWFDDFFPAFRDENDGKMMKTDVKDDGQNYELSVEVPGLKKNEIHLTVDDGYLTIAAEEQHSNDQKDKNGKYLRKERFSGSYQRSFYVGDLDEKDVRAKLADGVLTVTFPKEREEKEEEHHIEIE